MASGLVYAGIVLVWAWYIGTRVVHAREVRRVDAGESGAPGRVVRRAGRRSAPADRPAVAPGPVPSPARTAALRRRRRVLLSLVVLTLVLGVCSALGLLPVWAPAPAGLLAVAHLATGIRVARRSRAAASPPARDAAPALVRTPVDDSAWAGVPYVDVVADWCRDAGPSQAPPPAPEVAGPAWTEQSVSGTDAAPEVAERSWQAVPVPLPTYVTAPRVARTVTTIDLGSTGAWTSGRIAPVPVALPVAAPDEPAVPDGADGTAERPATPGPAEVREVLTAAPDPDGEQTEELDLRQVAVG